MYVLIVSDDAVVEDGEGDEDGRDRDGSEGSEEVPEPEGFEAKVRWWIRMDMQGRARETKGKEKRRKQNRVEGDSTCRMSVVGLGKRILMF